MSIDNLSPSVTTSPMLVSDTVNVDGGSQDTVQPYLTKNEAGETVSAAFEVKSTNGGVLIPRLSQKIIDEMTVINGMFYYNTDEETFDFNADGVTIPIGSATGDVLGPDESVDGNIAIFDGATGKIIADSGVPINQVPAPVPHLIRGFSPAAPMVNVNQIGNLGHIQFVNDSGLVFVDSLVGIQLITNTFSFDPNEDQVCSLITGGLPGSSTTPSCLLELQSDTGALVVSRMGTTDLENLHSTNGMIVYDTDVHKFKMFEGGAWEIIDNTPPEGDEAYPPTYNNQAFLVSQGYSQGGLGGSLVGLTKTMSESTTSFFDTTTVDSGSHSFCGAAFDGRNIYMVPNNSGQITRYDTHSASGFNSVSSYEVFDMASIDEECVQYAGAVYDENQYIYFVPFNFSGKLVRYDTRATFTDEASYEVFDLTTVSADSVGFFGAIVAGKYIYFIPFVKLGDPFIEANGQITRYDTTLPFGDAGSYSVYDTRAVSPVSAGFSGACYDGQFIYLVPTWGAPLGMASGQITRYDTTLSFTDAGSYSIYNTSVGVDAASKGFRGAVYDGQYIYFIPADNGVPFGQITRYNTALSFTDNASYDVHDTTGVNANSKGFLGGFYDGRYVYFVPNNNGAEFGQITRYDVTKDFKANGSYQVLDTTSINANSKGFYGGICDGRYGYFIPNSNGQITRIETYNGPPVPVLTHY